MSRLLTVVLVVSAAFAMASRFAADTGAQPQSFTLTIAGADRKPAGNLPVSITAGGASNQLGITDAAGLLAIALDPAKNGKQYNVYRQDCSRIVMHEVGTAEDKSCQDDSKKDASKDGCGGCRLLGAFTFGTNGTVGKFSSSHAMRNTVIGGAAAAIIGVAAAQGGSSPAVQSPTVSTPAFVSLDGSYAVTLNFQAGGCAGFAPQFSGTIAVSNHTSDGSRVTARLIEQLTREYIGTLQRGSFDGTGSGAFASGRQFTGRLTTTISAGRATATQEVLQVGALGANPACTATYTQ